MSGGAIGILFGIILVLWKLGHSNKKIEDLRKRAAAGDVVAHFKLRGVNFHDPEVQADLETFEDPGGRKQWLEEAIKAKRMPADVRNADSRYSVEFLNFVNNNSFAALKQMLDDFTLDHNLFLKWKEQNAT